MQFFLKVTTGILDLPLGNINTMVNTHQTELVNYVIHLFTHKVGINGFPMNLGPLIFMCDALLSEVVRHVLVENL